MPGQGQVERIAGWSWSAMPDSRWQWYAWFALFVAPIPLADLLERSCISPMIRRFWDLRVALFPALDRALTWIGLGSRSGDLTVTLWNHGCAALQTIPYVLLVVVGRLVWLRGRGRIELHPMTASRTLGVLGLMAATRLPSSVIGWGAMTSLNALLQRDEELAVTLANGFNDLSPWLGYLFNKVPAALIALVALHVAVRCED